MAIAGMPLNAIDDFKSKIGQHFDISDMGELSWFLGFEVKHDRVCRTLSLNQRSYIQAMTEKFNLSNAKLTHLPALPGEILSRAQSPSNPEERDQMKNVPYAQAIGHVLWPVIISRPDAVFQVNLLAQFVQSPGRVHWNALKRLMCYLHMTRDLWLVIGGSSSPNPVIFSDVDWGSQTDHHSISRYAMRMGEGAITWSSKKQPVVALSSTESEHIGLTHASKEILWVRQFLGEIFFKFQTPSQLYFDNQGAIALARNNKYHARSKHIDIRYHFICQVLERNDIDITYVPTDQNIADIFTKALLTSKFNHFRNLLGLRFA
jgi:hypothetical protein